MRIKLKQLRESQGFTQKQVAEVIGLARNSYTQIETGEKTPSLPVALKIKEALNYTGDDIFDNS